MNRKNGTFGIAVFLALVIFIFGGCVQPVETDNGSRDTTFEKDSFLIEVWDSSTPPKFLGYDTGLGTNNDYYYGPIILTSKGYCVQLRWRNNNICYGQIANLAQNVDFELRDEIARIDGWGLAVFFATANPTANDIPYGGWWSNIINNVMYNPNNGGTYYTRDRNLTAPNITIQANFKLYDGTGALLTFNDNSFCGEPEINGPATRLIGENFNEWFVPLKKIGGYAELGLPNPATTTRPWVFKVKE